jgi:hypothetical protein
MKKLLSLLIITTAILPLFAQVGIIVDRDLYPSVRTSIMQYKTDLTSRIPVNVWIDSTTFNSTSSVVSLRDDIRGHFQSMELEGVVLVGDLPIAMYEVENDFMESGYADFPCDLYFMDLDGTWEDNAQAGAWNGNAKTGYFDNHIDGFGSRAPEIWVSRIVPAATPGLGSEDVIVNDYFARLHSHMTGKYTIPRMLLTLGDSDVWPGLRTEMGDGLWFSSNETVQFGRGFDSGSIWTKELRKGYQYANVYEHSGPDGHAMIGGFSNRDFLNMPSNGTKSNILFSNLFACSNARYTYPDFLGGLYGWGHNGLISVGSTKTGSMLGFNVYNQVLGAGSTFGSAFKDWFTQVGLSDISWHYGMTLLGVGTLRPFTYLPDVYTPTNLDVTSISPTEIRITWEDNSYNETGYLLERATSGGNFTQISVLDANTSQTVNSVPASGVYCYRVRAFNGSDTTIYSNVDSSSTFTNIAPGKSATASSVQNGNTITNAIDNSISTRWAASSGSFPQWYQVDLGGIVSISGCEIAFEITGRNGDCYDFTIQTSDDNWNWTNKVNLTYNTNTAQTQTYSFSDTARYVRITFTDAPGYYFASMYEFRVVGNPCPPAPTLLYSNRIDENQQTITWSPSSGATYYTIKRSTIQGGPYTWCETGLTGTSYNTTNLVADSTYYFVLSASNALGESPNSNELTVYSDVSIPIAPTNPWFCSNDTLRWNDNSHNESGFEIVRSPFNQDNWTFVGQVGANQSKFFDTDRLNNPNTTFKYRVLAYNSAGFSSYTNAVTLSDDPCAGVQGGGNGLNGTVFGLTPPWAAGSEYCKATDGDIGTFYDFSQANGGYTGIDLGTAKAIRTIRYYPRESFASRMVGGKFQGSNTLDSIGYVDLYTIPSTPGTGWNVVTIPNATAYRWVRYVSPNDGFGNIAEMEFYQ